MKKTLSIILTLFLLFALTGCNGTADENGSIIEKGIVNETIKAHTDAQVATGSGTLPELSAEDKAVKTEIAKYSDTKIDFRYNKQEKIGNITYNLIFERVGFTGSNNDKDQKITYRDSNDDEFVYNIKTGNLRTVTFYSKIVDKSNKSISMEEAQKLARKIASQYCDIGEYTLSRSKEMFRGYDFLYSRYVNGYETTDNVGVTIGYNGELVYTGICTDTFNGIDLKIDENWINAKLKEAISNYEAGTAEVIDKWISVENGKPCLMAEVAYGIAPDGTIGTAATVYTFPFEN